MNIISHVVSRTLGSPHGVYLDTNAWSSLAKSEAPLEPLEHWLKETSQTLVMTRFSIGELSRDDRLALRVASVIEKLDVLFVDLGTNDLSGKPWKEVPYELFMRLTPRDDDARAELVRLFKSPELRATMGGLSTDGEKWRKRVSDAISSRPRHR